jgi:hypothetical protein
MQEPEPNSVKRMGGETDYIPINRFGVEGGGL